MLLPDGKVVLVDNPDRLNEAKFLKLALTEFPQLSKEFAEEEGLFHLQMAALSCFAQAAMEGNDFDTLNRCYALLAEVMKSATFEVVNAIYVSFLENLDFERSPYGAEAQRLLPPMLRDALTELQAHWREVSEWRVMVQDSQQRVREERERRLRGRS